MARNLSAHIVIIVIVCTRKGRYGGLHSGPLFSLPCPELEPVLDTLLPK